MTTVTTEPKKTKTKTTNGNGTKPVALAKLDKLPRGSSRSVQETFRATPEEHNKMVAEAKDGGFASMSDFYRDRLGLDK